MSRFSGGTRGGITVNVKPLDFRRRSFYKFWTFPYYAGTSVPFEIEITGGDAELHKLPLNYVASSLGEIAYRPFHDTHLKKGKVNDLVMPSAGSLEVWLGEASRPQSVLLVHADPVNPTQLILTVLTSVITTLATIFMTRLVN